MAARETGFGAVEQYMHAGKLLALELLVRAFENPHHHWSALRAEVRRPRQPNHQNPVHLCHAGSVLAYYHGQSIACMPACKRKGRRGYEQRTGRAGAELHEAVCCAWQFCGQLRAPLCLALLRNCTSAYDEAYAAATRLFGAILLQPRLRCAPLPYLFLCRFTRSQCRSRALTFMQAGHSAGSMHNPL